MIFKYKINKFAYPFLILHDTTITKIILNDNKISFDFINGFLLDNKKKTKRNSRLEIITDIKEIIVLKSESKSKLLTKFTNRNYYKTEYMDLNKLISMVNKGVSLEIVEEFYKGNSKIILYCRKNTKKSIIYITMIIPVDNIFYYYN